MSTIKKYTPDIFLVLFTFISKVLSVIMMDSPKKKAQSFHKASPEEVEVKVREEVDSIQGLGTGGVPSSAVLSIPYLDVEDSDLEELMSFVIQDSYPPIDIVSGSRTLIIKEVRSVSGWNLKDSKAFVDRFFSVVVGE